METLSKDVGDNKNIETLESSLNKSSFKNETSGIKRVEKVTFVRADMADVGVSI